jgi:ankyrin repeat protein
MCAGHVQDRTNRTALHWAAESNHVETARTLLDFGIDLKAQECMGRSVDRALVKSCCESSGRRQRLCLTHRLRQMLRTGCSAFRCQMTPRHIFSQHAGNCADCPAGPRCTWQPAQQVQT